LFKNQIGERSSLALCAALGYDEICDDTEMITGPHAVGRLIEEERAGGDVQGRSVKTAAHQNVVDPPAELQRRLTIDQERMLRRRYQRIAWREGVASFSRMGALPLVRNMILGAEQVDDLVVVVSFACFPERNKIRSQCVQAVDQL